MGVLPDHDYESTLTWLVWARGNITDVFGKCHSDGIKGGGQMGRGGLWVCSSVWYEKCINGLWRN